MTFLGWDDSEPEELEVRDALGILHDSPDEARRVRLLDPSGEERAQLVGVLGWEEGEGWVRFTADQGDGLVASLTIPVDLRSHCTTRSNGTITCTMPNGAQWVSQPLCEEAEPWLKWAWVRLN